jgi:hypothetical protein
MDASELKRELAKVKSGKSERYSAALRDAVVEYAAKAKEHGKSHAKVGKSTILRASPLMCARGGRGACDGADRRDLSVERANRVAPC